MTAAEILALISMAMRLGNTAVRIYEQMIREGRDKLTPEELATLKVEQGEAEVSWAEQLQRLRDAEPN